MWLKLCPLNIFTILCSTEEWLPLCDIIILIFPMPTFFSPGIFPAQALSFFLLFFSPCSHLEKTSRGDVFYLTIFTDTAMVFPVAFYQLSELNFPSRNYLLKVKHCTSSCLDVVVWNFFRIVWVAILKSFCAFGNVSETRSYNQVENCSLNDTLQMFKAQSR